MSFPDRLVKTTLLPMIAIGARPTRVFFVEGINLPSAAKKITALKRVLLKNLIFALLALNSVMVTSKSLTVNTVLPDTAISLIPLHVFSSAISLLSLYIRS